ncbi:ribonuclease Z [Alicyclobacillus sp. TC]|uniref:Ribonuclease Z n=2 Tax=Alicyclobacillus tolerans TaxID=90970 RepID=A0ABT9LS90_9BACL|nr:MULTISPECIES: ribonuclease Z [Alicyclobacillus]MDP9727125.1 ribonuclease Z [Alicyclobacillus tengchongensis]QRF22896.1 ribonuclease Z [Alicyclobacillus sp. TC]SHK47813.1 ribonuclease Z [Alicyclobacillus montanus]
MELYFLGTGAGLPSKRRNVSSLALRLESERSSFWLFDCGEGTQQRMLNSPLSPQKLEKVFISHLHGDHLYGLPGMMASRGFQGGESPVVIYGPHGVEDFLKTAFSVSHTYLPYHVQFVTIYDGWSFEDDQFQIHCRVLNHTITSYGFRIEEKEKPGRLRAEQLQLLGISPGPLYGDLKKGLDVRLPDGTILRSKDYLDPPRPGRIITLLGDTRPTEVSIDLAHQSDWLVHEGTYRHSDAHLALNHGHSTNVEAAMIAKKAGSQCLILTHLSARYNEKELHDYWQEAAAIFPNTLIAHDHMSIPLS